MTTHIEGENRTHGEKRTHIDITIRKLPMPLYLKIMQYGAEYGMSQNMAIQAALQKEFLGQAPLDFFNLIPDELKTAIQGYANAAGLSLREQIVKDLKEMYL